MDAYERSALAYELIQVSRGRNCASQCEQLREIVRAEHPHAEALLDVACGTGQHLAHLRSSFRAEGLDISASMLERARRNVPDVPLHCADMRDFSLTSTFDVLICLFSSIGYLTHLDDMRSAVATMARHLNPGGVLIVEPWFHPSTWSADYRRAEAANIDGVALSRVSVNGLTGHISSFDLHWTIATSDTVDTFVEHHELALYTAEEYRAAMQACGLRVTHDPHGLIGRGLFVGHLNK